MIIKFKSKITNQGKDNVIKFSAPVIVSQYHEFQVYEFVEPSQKEMNRIEISADKINIMAGPSTIELDLNQELEIVYEFPNQGQVKFISKLEYIKFDGKKTSFAYILKNQGEIIGKYHIALTVE